MSGGRPNASSVARITSADWRAAYPSSTIRPAYSVLDCRPYEQLVGRPMRSWRDALADYRAAVAADGF